MLSGEIKQKAQSLPAEEISDNLTPEQRNMLTYKRLQTELGMDNKRITEGIEAIVMGKHPGAKKSDKEPGVDEGVGFNERDGDEVFGG